MLYCLRTCRNEKSEWKEVVHMLADQIHIETNLLGKQAQTPESNKQNKRRWTKEKQRGQL
jgi:hypothetical protein